MMAGGASLYRSAPGIVWLKDASQTIVVDRHRRSVWCLDVAQAAIWDLLTLGHSFEHIVHVLALIMGVSEAQACASLVSTLEQWSDAGIIQREGDLAWRT